MKQSIQLCIKNADIISPFDSFDSIPRAVEAGRIVRKELLNADTCTTWPQSEKELLANKFDTPPLTETLWENSQNLMTTGYVLNDN